MSIPLFTVSTTKTSNIVSKSILYLSLLYDQIVPCHTQFSLSFSGPGIQSKGTFVDRNAFFLYQLPLYAQHQSKPVHCNVRHIE